MRRELQLNWNLACSFYTEQYVKTAYTKMQSSKSPVREAANITNAVLSKVYEAPEIIFLEEMLLLRVFSFFFNVDLQIKIVCMRRC